jgi:hypothetical protein
MFEVRVKVMILSRYRPITSSTARDSKGRECHHGSRWSKNGNGMVTGQNHNFVLQELNIVDS